MLYITLPVSLLLWASFIHKIITKELKRRTRRMRKYSPIGRCISSRTTNILRLLHIYRCITCVPLQNKSGRTSGSYMKHIRSFRHVLSSMAFSYYLHKKEATTLQGVEPREKVQQNYSGWSPGEEANDPC